MVFYSDLQTSTQPHQAYWQTYVLASKANILGQSNNTQQRVPTIIFNGEYSERLQIFHSESIIEYRFLLMLPITPQIMKYASSK